MMKLTITTIIIIIMNAMYKMLYGKLEDHLNNAGSQLKHTHTHTSHSLNLSIYKICIIIYPICYTHVNCEKLEISQ